MGLGPNLPIPTTTMMQKTLTSMQIKDVDDADANVDDTDDVDDNDIYDEAEDEDEDDEWHKRGWD